LRNLQAEEQSLRVRVGQIRRRLAITCGDREGNRKGYATRDEQFQKQRRLQILLARLEEVEFRLAEGRMSICRGGRRLAHQRPRVGEGALSAWRDRWEAARRFITADGEANKQWGNETIRWHPEEHWLELKLPTTLAHLANQPHGRYRLSDKVSFPYRGDEVAAQAASGAVRYDVAFRPDGSRWYLDASWQTTTQTLPLEELRGHPVMAIDLNASHLAAVVVDPSGNPVRDPLMVSFHFRDGREAAREETRPPQGQRAALRRA
jgi:hypothetical protein